VLTQNNADTYAEQRRYLRRNAADNFNFVIQGINDKPTPLFPEKWCGVNETGSDKR